MIRSVVAGRKEWMRTVIGAVGRAERLDIITLPFNRCSSLGRIISILGDALYLLLRRFHSLQLRETFVFVHR